MNNSEVFDSVCPLDCPDTCSVKITVKNGQVTQLGGNPDHPITRGFACVKMAKFPKRQHHSDRLLYPQRRVGPKGAGQFERISWDEALETIASRLKENISRHGDSSVLPFCYAGTMGLIERDYPLAFFRALGASELDQTVCAATGGAGWAANYGPMKLSTPPEDVQHSKLIILWGINVLRSNSHLVPWLKLARKNGAHIVHIDPYRNETSRLADEHWQVGVGTDAALALAIGGEIIRLGGHDQDYLDKHCSGVDEYIQATEKWSIDKAAALSGIEAEKIQELASRIASEKATFIKVGYGMTRNEGGGNATRAISLLPALIGAWKHKGGGGALSTSGAFQLNTHRFMGEHLQKPDRPVVNQNQLGRALNEEGRLSTLFVFNSNPAAITPDSKSVRKGLEREDLFTVVLEQFQTDSADYADILLPATTFVEHPDIYAAYGHYHLQWADQIVPETAECKPNSWVFRQLAQRIGLKDPIFKMESHDLARELLETEHPFLEGITFEKLKSEKSVQLSMPKEYLPYSDGSTFSDRKIRFSPAPEQVEFHEQLSEDFPLRLISPPGPYILNTSMGNIPELIKAAGGEPTVLVHPSDADRYGVADETRIQITSQYGEIVRKAIVTTDAREGVVIALGQWWPKLAPDKRSLNDLTCQELTDLGGGSLFGNAVVRIEAFHGELAEV